MQYYVEKTIDFTGKILYNKIIGTITRKDLKGGSAMFCSQCGSRIDDNARFCPQCGAVTGKGEMGAGALPSSEPVQPVPSALIQGQRVTENIYLCQDGYYRWVYEFSLMKNPTIMITLAKVLGLSVGLVYLFVLLLAVFEGNFESIGGMTLGFLIGLLGFLALGFISYVIYAGMNGWKYCVMFEMNETGVTHKQMETAVKKSELLQDIGILAGLLTGNMTVTGAALMIRTSMSTDFDKVKNIKARRGRHTIYVNEMLCKNQVYAASEDFDFVLNFINARIPAAAARK